MNASWDQRGLIDDLVARGVDDWIDIGLVVDIARRTGASASEAANLTAMGLVAVVLVDRLMEAGDVAGGTFHPWGTSPVESLGRIIRGWIDLGDAVICPGDVAWLSNTEAGDLRGRAVLDREVGDG